MTERDTVDLRLSRLRDASAEVRPRVGFTDRVMAHVEATPPDGWWSLVQVARFVLPAAATVAIALVFVATKVEADADEVVALSYDDAAESLDDEVLE